MLILLPPSETKISGGDGPSLSRLFDAAHLGLDELRFSALTPARRAVVAAAMKLAATPSRAVKVWRLTPKQSATDLLHNSTLLSSPTMAAMDRYQGVLYEALNASHLHSDARAFLAANVIIQSALLGPISAADPIPAYRLSYNSALPALRDPVSKKSVTIRQLWPAWAGQLLNAEIDNPHTGLTLDLRSEAYSALTPVAAREGAYFLRVLSRGEGGETRALNHFNKKAKGEFVRLCAEHYLETARINSPAGLSSWAKKLGVTVEPGAPSGKTGLPELNLVLENSLSIKQ